MSSPLRAPEINHLGHLVVGGCDVVELARAYGTPVHLLDEAWIRARCREYVQALAAHGSGGRVLFAGKSFLTTGFCRLLMQEGLSLDVVSGGELATALAAGFPSERIWFHGNNKSDAELACAVEAGVGCIVVDSFDEIERLRSCRARAGRVQGVQLRLTPGIKPSTHSYIQTGQVDSKFGFTLGTGHALEGVRRVLGTPGLELRGLHCHIGSQIHDLAAFEAGAEAVVAFAATLRHDLGYLPRELNLGGGLGIAYLPDEVPPPPAAYVERLVAAVRRAWAPLGEPLPAIMVEPGRSIVGEAGVTLYRAGTIKRIEGVRLYASVDGGMTDNPRAALYQARYHARLASRMHEAPVEPVTLCGKCCETGDVIARDVPMPEMRVGDLVAVFSTGAYHYAMSSAYNRIPRGAVLLVRDGQAHVLVRAQTYDDLRAFDEVPPHLV